MEGCQEGIISSDGANLYVVSQEDDALVHFLRNPTTGELSFQKAYMDEADGGDFLAGASGLSLSANGENLYVIAHTDQSVSRFTINDSGELTLAQTLLYTGIIEGLRAPVDMTVSPDGQHLYVISDAFDSMSAFSINAATGALNWIGNYQNNTAGVVNFDRPHTILVSPDGQQVYVTCESYNGIVAFNRNPDNGALTYLNSYQPDGFNGSHYATSMIISGEGLYLYIAFPDGIYQYDRNTLNGTLTESNFFALENIGNTLIRNVLVLNETDALLYATQRFSNKMTIFQYDLGDGFLFETASIQNGQNGVLGLENINSIFINPSENQLYSCAMNANNFVIGRYSLSADGMPQFVDIQEDMGLVVDGLNNNYHGEISPDGRFLYVSGSADDAIAILEIDQMDGQVTYIGKVQNGLNGTAGLEGVTSTEISPNGLHLYATGSADNSLVVFDRNPITGLLTYKTKYTESSGGTNYGLLGCYESKISDDGQFLYVVSLFRHALLVFQRNVFTGELSFLQIMEDGINGVDGLNFATALQLSADQNHIYVTGSGDDAIAIFSRDATTGLVTLTGTVVNNQNGVTGLDYPARLVMSADDNFIYVAARNSNAVTVFARNMLSGQLTFFQTITDNQNGVNGLEDAYAIAISPDGERVYVSGEGDESLALFSRNATNGMLEFTGRLTNGTAGNAGIENVADIQISSDNRFVYTIDEDGDGVGVYYNCTVENLMIDAGEPVELTCLFPVNTLQATASSGSNITYQWTTNDGEILSGSTALNPMIGAPGLYEITLLSAPFGCQISDTVSVIAVPNDLEAITASTPTDINLANGTAIVTPIAGVAPFSYLWNTSPPVTDSIATNLAAGIYLVTVTDANGCEIIEEVEVEIILNSRYISPKESVKLFPNPVSDFLNLSFESAGPSSIDLQIFNTLGKIIWETEGYTTTVPIQINTGQWPIGQYICQMRINDQIYQQIFIKH